MRSQFISRALLATLLLAGGVGSALADDAADLRGTWYLAANPNQPTSIGIVNGANGPAFVFTNEKGDSVTGQMTDRDTLTTGWQGPNGFLNGHIRGDFRRNAIIDWDNGSSWTRIPDRPILRDEGHFGGVRDDWHYPDRRHPDVHDHEDDHRVYRPWR